MTFLKYFGFEKEKKEKKPREKTDYDKAYEQIEQEEIANKVSFLRAENYSSNVINNLAYGGFEDTSKQLGLLRLEYLDCAENSVPLNGEIPEYTAELFDKILINKLFHKTLEGKLNGDYKENYKEFYNKHLNGNGFVPYEKRKELLDSFEKVSKWVSGQDVEKIKESLGNINNYLLEEIKEDHVVIAPAYILNKRVSNLFEQHNEKVSDKKGTYSEFPLFANTIDKVLKSHEDSEIDIPYEAIVYLHDTLTNKYAGIHENKIYIGDSLKKQAEKIYFKTAGKMYTPIHSIMKDLGEKLYETENLEQREELFNEISDQFSFLGEIEHLFYQNGKPAYAPIISEEILPLIGYVMMKNEAKEEQENRIQINHEVAQKQK